MFFSFKKELRELRLILESEEDAPHIHYTIREIRCLDDIAQAIIEREKQGGLLYVEILSWIFNSARSKKLKAHWEPLLTDTHKQVSINYQHVAKLIATGDSHTQYADWKWDEVPHKALVKKLLQQHMDGCTNASKHQDSSEILEKLEHSGAYTEAELRRIRNPDMFMQAIKNTQFNAIDIIEEWALLGHVGAYQLLLKTLKGDAKYSTLLEKWQGIISSTPHYPILVADTLIQNKDELSDWLRHNNNPASFLILSHEKLEVSQWLTITQSMSERAASQLAAESRQHYHPNDFIVN